jgi:PEP-CTERM motif
VLRGVTYAHSNPSSQLYTINPLTGLGTLVGPTGFSMEGLASVPVPEPSAFLLLALGATALVAYARRRPMRNSSF